MDLLNLKIKLVEECKKQQLEMVSNLKNTINEAQQSANEYGPPKDRYDSFRMQLLRKKDMFSQQLEKALNELYVLDKIDLKKEIKKIGFGSVIITPEQKIFIAIGLGKILLENDLYLAVSVNVPLAKPFLDKSKGDIVEFNGKKIEIVETF